MGKKRSYEQAANGDDQKSEGEHKKFCKASSSSLSLVMGFSRLNNFDFMQSEDNSKPLNGKAKSPKIHQISPQKAQIWLAKQYQLCEELSRNPELAEQCHSIVGEDVIALLSQVGQALREQRSLLSLDPSHQANCLPIISKLEEPPKGSGSQSLPPLPPIRDPELEKAVFTHRGTLNINQQHDIAKQSYERLEFLGDAYIEMAASRLLYHKFPAAMEGKLSSFRENLVKNDTLADFALAYELDKRTQLPQGFYGWSNLGKDYQKKWTKTLADVFEAYVGAVVESDHAHGYSTVESWLSALWRRHLPGDKSFKEDALNVRAKEDLSRKIMGRGIKLEYLQAKEPQPSRPGRIMYTMGVYLTGWGWEKALLAIGTGESKGDAGLRAATKAMANPATGQVHAIKLQYDALVQEERARAEGPRDERLRELDEEFKSGRRNRAVESGAVTPG